nr:MAG TPA: hypothetical protein [Caudoviricetes sp.]
MREERAQEILQMLEQTPTQPLRILIPHEADEVMSYVLRKYRSAHRIELHNGIHYITVTDEAVSVILDRLQRERADFQRTLAKYDEDIRGVEYLLENPQKRHYWSQSSYIVPPAYSEQ